MNVSDEDAVAASSMLDVVKEIIGATQNIIFVVTITVAIALFLYQAWLSFRIATRLAPTWGHGVRMVVGLAVLHPLMLVSTPAKFFALVRRRIEFEIFNPRPRWRWPLRDDDELYASFPPASVRRARSNTIKDSSEIVAEMRASRTLARAEHRTRLREWRAALHKARRNPTITLELAGEINDSLSDIKFYFDTLKALGIQPDQLEFLCPIKVEIGFIAFQHLLTGLLTRYNEKWAPIINGFERDTNDVRNLTKGQRTVTRDMILATRNLSQIQSFIYHCWLLWGPSIPVCDDQCARWKADLTTLQYGYGDENNAIELVGEREILLEQIAELLENPNIERDAMAIPASVYGRLRYSSVIAAESNAIGAVLQDSWYGKQDERPVLFLSQEEKVSPDSPDGKEGYKVVGEIKEEIRREGDKPDRSRYYSAYFWVMFLLLRETAPGSDIWEIAYPAPDQKLPSDALWMTSIPFFEHGNMADAVSCEFAKHQLAEKALSGLAFMVEQWEKATSQRFPWRFAYACAIDDPNCGRPLAVTQLPGGDSADGSSHPPLQGGATLRSLMEERLSTKEGIAGSRTGDLRRRKLVDFEFHDPSIVRADGETAAIHAACRLSGDVKRHYESLDRLKAADERD